MRNSFINIVKLVASVFVVFIHCRFPGKVGWILYSLARFAVPFFFAISGRFFIVDKDFTVSQIRKTAVKRIKRMAPVTLMIWFVYTMYSFLWFVIDGYSIQDWGSIKYNHFELVKFLLFTTGAYIYDLSYSFDHMWFMFALIYVYAFIWLLAPVFKKIYIPLMILLFVCLFGGELGQLLFYVQLKEVGLSAQYILRNWLFVGCPFFLFGVWISQFAVTRRAYEQLYDGTFVFEKKIIGWIILICGVVSTIIENRIVGGVEVHIGSLIILVALMWLTEVYRKLDVGKISDTCSELSKGIYYWHILVLAILSSFFKYLDNNNTYLIFKPLLVIVFTAILTIFINIIIRYFNNSLSKRLLS